MGLLRLLLAFVVILAHSGGYWHMLGGGTAVEAFFIISGFYMALILNEKYKGPGSTWLFYSNRLWRLFPLYWLLTLTLFTVSLVLWKTGYDPAWLSWWIKYGNQLAPSTKAYLIFVNLFALGQDTTFFVGLTSSGHLEIVKDFQHTNPPIYQFLFVGQAWSMSVELMFYAVAPLLVRLRPRLLFGVFLMLLALRVRLSFSSYSIDPWIGRFFPTALPLFLAGVLSYWAYTRVRTMNIPLLWMRSALAFVVGLTLVYQWLPETRYTAFCYFFIFAAAIPFVFQLTKSNKRDAALGEYSFPIYLSHTLPLYFVRSLCASKGWSLDVAAVLETLCALPIAWILIRYVGDPIEKIRAQRARKLTVNRPPQHA